MQSRAGAAGCAGAPVRTPPPAPFWGGAAARRRRGGGRVGGGSWRAVGRGARAAAAAAAAARAPPRAGLRRPPPPPQRRRTPLRPASPAACPAAADAVWPPSPGPHERVRAHGRPRRRPHERPRVRRPFGVTRAARAAPARARVSRPRRLPSQPPGGAQRDATAPRPGPARRRRDLNPSRARTHAARRRPGCTQPGRSPLRRGAAASPPPPPRGPGARPCAHSAPGHTAPGGGSRRRPRPGAGQPTGGPHHTRDDKFRCVRADTGADPHQAPPHPHPGTQGHPG